MKIKSLIAVLCLYHAALGSSAHAATEFGWCAPTTNVDGTPLTDLGGFKLYCGLTSGNYTIIKDAGMAVSVPTTPACAGLGPEYEYPISSVLNSQGTYYCAATAYDAYVNESSFSNEIIVPWGDGRNPPRSLRVARFTWGRNADETPAPPAEETTPADEEKSPDPSGFHCPDGDKQSGGSPSGIRDALQSAERSGEDPLDVLRLGLCELKKNKTQAFGEPLSVVSSRKEFHP